MRKQKRIQLPEECINKWILFDENNDILFCSRDIGRIVEEGKKYNTNQVSIQKATELGTCFY